jgi:hypothetical protein
MIERPARKRGNVETDRLEMLLPRIISEYRHGKPATSLAKRYGFHTSTIYRRLRWENVDVRSRSEVKQAGLNPMWRGDDVKSNALHIWVRGHLPKPTACTSCHISEPLDVANVSPSYDKATYNRDSSNWRWLCRRCHMLSDGRMKNLKRNSKEAKGNECREALPEVSQAHTADQAQGKG